MNNFLINEIAQPQIHEIEISKIFNGNVRFDGTEPVFDSPIALLLFANRSGSNLLAEHLLSSGRFSGLQEILNFDTVGTASRKHGLQSFPEYFQAIALDNIRTNIFGTKCSLDQLIMLLRWNILSMFSGAKIINIERNDVVSQAVSMSIALQTASWSSDVAPTTSATYNFEEIKHYFTHFSADTIRRRILIDVLDFDTKTFEYDQVVSNPLEVVAECCKLFEVHPPKELPGKTKLKKQGGEINKGFATQFRHDIRHDILGNF